MKIESVLRRLAPHIVRPIAVAMLVAIVATAAAHAQQKVTPSTTTTSSKKDPSKTPSKPARSKGAPTGKVVPVTKDMESTSPTIESDTLIEPDQLRTIEKHSQDYNISLQRHLQPGIEEDVQGRDEWFFFQRRYPFDMIPAGARAAAVMETKRMEAKLAEDRLKGDRLATALSASRWEPIGPTNIGGRVPAIAQHPTKAGVIYIGAASGGVWKTTDDGATWNTTFDKEEALSVGALAIDYAQPEIIYAGTGESYSHTEDYFGHGVFKSTDEGATWRNVGLTNVGGFAKIYVSRQNHLTVYAACSKGGGGFYRSDDGGEHWSELLPTSLLDMSVDPHNDANIYVATSSSVLHSTDGGQTFVTITGTMNVSNATRISVAMAPSNPQRVYALVARFQAANYPNAAEFYASNNGGKTWSFQKTLSSAFFNEQGFYDNLLLVHPDSADVVLAGGIDVYRSEDGGHNFVNYTEVYSHLNDPTAVHADQHVLEFDPKNHNRLLLGNDGGLFASEDAGMDWSRVTLDLPITQFYKMDVDQNNPSLVYGGSQDNGSSGSLNGGDQTKRWTSITGADGFFVVADPLNSGIVYTEIYYGTPIFRVDINNPGNAVPIDDAIGLVSGDKGDWSSPLLIGYSDARIYSGRRSLWRTADGGGNWEQLRPGNGGLISAVAVTPSLTNPGEIIIGTSYGELRYTVDDGQSWRTPTGTPNQTVSDLRYDPIEPHRIYATFSGQGPGHVFRSENDGASFVNITSNLPNSPVNTICIDQQNNQHLFVGTDAGAFVSLNGGKLWLPFNEGLPLAPVVDLKLHTASRTLYAATHGRSMFKINIANVQAQPVVVEPVSNAKYTTPGPLTASWAGFTGPVRVSISYDGGGTYTVVATDVLADNVVIDLPLVKTAMARIKVEQTGGSDLSALSGLFSLVAQANGSVTGNKGFVAEAIEFRRGWLWATVRGSDSIYQVKPTPFGGKIGALRTGIPGHVIDMAYDSTIDVFYLLTAADDFSGPKLYRMDTNCVGHGEIALPADITHATGVAVTGEGLALIAPGAAGEIFVIDTAGALLRRLGPLQGTTEENRRSLAWDGSGLIQGVHLADPAAWFPSQLEKIGVGTVARVGQRIPAVLPTDQPLVFFGIAADMSNPAVPVYWATDTTGSFYKFQQIFTGVDNAPTVTGTRARGISLEDVSPNPFRGSTTVRITATSARRITLELYRPNGQRVAQLFEGMVEAGERSIAVEGENLASGVYYMVLSGADGQRDMKPVVVVR